jgi:hypothetical protein
VEDSELRRSRRLLGLPPVILEPPPPPLRRKLDHQGSFEATGSFEPEQLPEESTANLGVIETPNIDTWPDIIVPIQFYERLSVPNPVMEPNVVTSTGNSSIPVTIVTIGEASPNLSSSVWTTMAPAVTSSQSGPTPSIVAATNPFTSSVTSAPFSYGMPSSGTSLVLTHSTLQTLGLGVGSSNAPLQGQLGGILVLFNAFPHTGGHIPPLSPSLGGPHQQTVGQPAHTSSLGAGSQGPPAQTQLVVRHRLFGMGRLVTTRSHPLLSHMGALPYLDSLLQHRVLFLRRGHIYQDLGTHKDPFLPLECRSGVILSTVNGTLDRPLCLSQ